MLLMLGVTISTYLNTINKTISYDEAYSIFLAKKSYIEIIQITAQDVHPPLYYWFLKIFNLLFSDSLFSFRMFSACGIFATMLLGCFPINRLFGNKVAILFILLLIIFPVTQFLATDIRMYSWTMFFTLLTAIYAFEAHSRGYKSDWIIFSVASICCAYMHNYGFLYSIGIYTYLFLVNLQSKRVRKYIILCFILFIIVYLPWFTQLILQINSISNDYWIKPLTKNDLFLHIYYFYSPKEIWLPFTDFRKGQMMVGLIFIIFIQLIITIKVLSTGWIKRDKSMKVIISAFILFIFPIMAGFIISILFMPIIVPRYMTCSYGLFLLCFAFIFAKAINLKLYRKLTYIFLILLAVDGCIRLYSNTIYYKQTTESYDQMRLFTNNPNDSNIFVANDFSYNVMPRIQVILPGNHYLVLTDTGKEKKFEPFTFKQVKYLDLDNFILVHQDREAIQDDFWKYWSALNDTYIIKDSLYATDLRLYKIHRR